MKIKKIKKTMFTDLFISIVKECEEFLAKK